MSALCLSKKRIGVTPLCVFPLSEYEELDESLQFLKGYDIYILVTILSEFFPESCGISTINENLIEYIRSRISDGTMESTFRYGNTGQCINVTSLNLYGMISSMPLPTFITVIVYNS